MPKGGFMGQTLKTVIAAELNKLRADGLYKQERIIQGPTISKNKPVTGSAVTIKKVKTLDMGYFKKLIEIKKKTRFGITLKPMALFLGIGSYSI